MSKRNGNLPSLADARARTPPVDPAEALRKDLRLAFMQAISADDVRQVAGKLIELARGGDHKAIQLLTTLLAAPPAASAQQVVIVNQGDGGDEGGPLIVDAVETAATTRLPPTATEFRLDVARLIQLEGPMTAETIGRRCGVPAAEAEKRITGSEWFEWGGADHKWHLSGRGFAEVNAERED